MGKEWEIIDWSGEVYARALGERAAVATVEELLEAGATPQARKALEEKAGIGHELIKVTH